MTFWTVPLLLNPEKNRDARYFQGYRKQLISDFTLRNEPLDKATIEARVMRGEVAAQLWAQAKADREAIEAKADAVLQTVCDAMNRILERYDGYRVRLEYIAGQEPPFAVYSTSYGKPERFHSITTARVAFAQKAKPIPVPHQPVCEDCEMVFRTDVPDPVWGDALSAPRCPCCGTFSYKKVLADLPKLAQQEHNRNTMRFFFARMRGRLFT
jgi:hypothetical protein